MEFTFSIRGALKESWDIFRKHVWFFLGISAVYVVLSFVAQDKKTALSSIVALIAVVASFVWSVVILKFSLAAADGKEEVLSFKHIKDFFPTYKQVIFIAGVSLLVGLITLAGLILIIIPGIWVAFRLSLSKFVYLDKGEGVRKSLRASYNMTKGHAFWTTVLVGIVSGILYLVGIFLFGVGILVTYPIAMILMAKFYRALSSYHGHTASHTDVVVQPVEIVAPAPEEHHESEVPAQ